MNRPIPPLNPREREASILRLCDEHLTREESLLADLRQTLHQVRDAFVERDLTFLVTLHDKQEQLNQLGQEIAQARERLREALVPVLGVAAGEVTLRAAALALEEPARGRLLARHGRLVEMVRESEQLTRHNAALLGYARGFLDCLFANLTGTRANEGYGPQGERRGALYGSFLEARV